MPSPLELDLSTGVLRVDTSARLTTEQWQAVLDAIADQVETGAPVLVTLDRSNAPGGEILIDAVVIALEARGIRADGVSLSR